MFQWLWKTTTKNAEVSVSPNKWSAFLIYCIAHSHQVQKASSDGRLVRLTTCFHGDNIHKVFTVGTRMKTATHQLLEEIKPFNGCGNTFLFFPGSFLMFDAATLFTVLFLKSNTAKITFLPPDIKPLYLEVLTSSNIGLNWIFSCTEFQPFYLVCFGTICKSLTSTDSLFLSQPCDFSSMLFSSKSLISWKKQLLLYVCERVVFQSAHMCAPTRMQRPACYIILRGDIRC